MVVAICPAEGLTSGCATLFSYYYGSGSYEHIVSSFRYVLLYTGLYLGALTLAIVAAPELFVRLFLSDPEAIAQAAVFARRYCMGFVFVAIQFAFVDGFTAMGMVKERCPSRFSAKACTSSQCCCCRDFCRWSTFSTPAPSRTALALLSHWRCTCWC